MLTPAEIESILKKNKKKEPVMIDARIAEASKDWVIDDPDLSPGKLALIYSYIKERNVQDESIEHMQKQLGFNMFIISKALRFLESQGYVAISRSSKPHNYRVIK